MYPAPPLIETRIFASLPEALRIRNRPSEISRMTGVTFDSVLEGPSFDDAGNLYCVDVPYGRIFRVDRAGHFHVLLEYEGEPNGLKRHWDGRLFVTDRRNGIVAINPVDGRMERVVQRAGLEPFRGTNDLAFSPDGCLYFTDQGMSDLVNPTGRVFRWRPEGKLELVVDNLPSPNGIAVDASGKVLYVALTAANSVIRVPLLSDGRAGRVQNFIQLSGGGGPDGLAVDADGGIAIAHLGIGVVWRFDNKGQPTLRVNLSKGSRPTNLAYGGPDNRDLHITEAETGTIHVAEMPVRGLAMPPAAL